jgi:4-diphosphocytidyl-2-C-methyl-D-erythritol kinase
MPWTLQKKSPCKINLLLNILGKRPDGFHELETVMHPVNLCDELSFSLAGGPIELTCNDPNLPTDSRNLVHRAASEFLAASGIKEGARIHLDKHIPQAAGLGGGSGNAATTLLGLNELFGAPLATERLHSIATGLGSDVPFFLQSKPALATGRGERITAFDFFPALRGTVLILIHPGFGISTAWSYQNLARYPSALNGRPGRAQKLIETLNKGTLAEAGAQFYNSLEAPALEKYPWLALLQEFFRAHGVAAVLMSGSGSTTFAITQSQAAADDLVKKLKPKFGESTWTATIPL